MVDGVFDSDRSESVTESVYREIELSDNQSL